MLRIPEKCPALYSISQKVSAWILKSPHHLCHTTLLISGIYLISLVLALPSHCFTVFQISHARAPQNVPHETPPLSCLTLYFSSALPLLMVPSHIHFLLPSPKMGHSKVCLCHFLLAFFRVSSLTSEELLCNLCLQPQGF